MRMERSPRKFVAGPNPPLPGAVLRTVFPPPGTCLSGISLGGRLDRVRQIWCREQRQALSMGTVQNATQGRSGKRILTHHILYVRGCAFLLGKVRVKRLTR